MSDDCMPEVNCIACGEPLWTYAERHGLCSECARGEAGEELDTEDDYLEEIHND